MTPTIASKRKVACIGKHKSRDERENKRLDVR